MAKKKKDTKQKPTPKPTRKSAVIPYRFKNDVLQFLLITPKIKEGKTQKEKQWMVPKGTIKADIRPAESARIEALEEAGVLGEVLSGPKGFYNFETKRGNVQKIYTYFMKVTYVMKNWGEKDQRRRKWVAMENIREYIDEPGLVEIIASNEIKLRRRLLWDRVRETIFQR
jgi:predicted NUDIX family NTP pyrophosphohydrolase